MTATLSPTSLVDARQSLLRALDPAIRRELAAAARAWAVDADAAIELTAYDRVFSRTPSLGGHWTLFIARTLDDRHEVASVTVAIEFDGETPVDLRVSGQDEVIAGACTVAALREALRECRGPLRQVTPLPLFARPRIAEAIAALLAPAR